ncbi:S-layer homology domain-containing protein [Marinitoga lauensis]|uniref:S-layer homology domain-containing protein n=1 Tax=Marinitoga lauensis TaxID=2201189 RepID=UPI00101064C0|nr:S-layer homology domain-containing protein [Marinitoga lauensis]
MKKLLIILMVLALAVFSFAATTYKDVPVNHWAFDSIERLSSLGIIEGFPDGTYQGLSQVNRYQLTVALDRALKYVEQQLFATLAEKVVALDKQVQQISKQSKGLSKDEVNAMIKNAMANIDTTSLDNKINELEASINELKSAYDVISFLSSKIDNVEKKVAALESNKTFEQKISSLENELNALKSLSADLEALKKDVASNKAAIESIGVLANKLADLETKVSAIDLDSVKSEISTFESKLASKADMDSVNTAIDTKVAEYLKDYAKLSDLENLNIDSLASRVASVETELTTLKGNMAKIDELSANIESVKVSVDTNSEKIKELGLKFDNYVTKDVLKEYPTFADLKQYATLGDLNAALKNYALKTDLSKYAVAADVDAKLGNYVTKSDLETQLEKYATSDSIVDKARVDKIEKTANQANILSWLGIVLGVAGVAIYFINPSKY